MSIDSHFMLIPVKHYENVNDMHEIKKREVTASRVVVANGHWNLQALASTQQYLDNRFCPKSVERFCFVLLFSPMSTRSDAANTIMVVTCTDKTF